MKYQASWFPYGYLGSNPSGGVYINKEVDKMAKNKTCKYPHHQLWCVSVMAVAIIVLTWLGSVSETWSRVIVTILAAIILMRSMMVNCCK
tara:strand:- start:410 stop:679 length:270 start_codon:yes stop_codon:yes gene_type:complete